MNAIYSINIIVVHKYAVNVVSFVVNKYAFSDLILSRLLFTLFTINKLSVRIDNPKVINKGFIEVFCLI